MLQKKSTFKRIQSLIQKSERIRSLCLPGNLEKWKPIFSQRLEPAYGIGFRANVVDTVVTNPPFGTKNNAGMDLRFLRTATRLARRAVYSFHKTSTRSFLLSQVRDVWGMKVEVVAEMKFELPKVYKFHKEKSVDIEVDLVRVELD